MVYGTTDIWTTMTIGQKFGFVYLWSLLAFVLPPLFLAWNYPFEPENSYFVYAILTIVFLINSFGVPVAIMRLNLRPFLSCKEVVDHCLGIQHCTNYSFLLPLAVAGVECLVFVFLEWVLDISFW
jgi:hypothetical protein